MKIELAGDQATIVLDALNLWLYEHQPVTPENQAGEISNQAVQYWQRLIIEHTGADLTLELCEKLIYAHQLHLSSNVRRPESITCECGLCHLARQIQAKLNGIQG